MLLYSINRVFITVYLAVNVLGREAISIYHPTIAAYEEDKLHLKCIRKLLSNYKPQITESLTTNMNLNALFAKPQISIDLRTSDATFPKEHVFVLRIDTSRERELFLEQIRRRKFHPKSKYIFTVEAMEQTDVENLFIKLVEKYICQVLVVKQMQVYTFFPYKYENLQEPDTEPYYLGYCLDVDENILNAPVYPNLWRNSTNRVYFKISPPYADEKFQGAEQRFGFYIADLLGIKVIPLVGYGGTAAMENSTFRDHGFELLSKGSVEIVFGGYNSEDHADYFETSDISIISKAVLIVPKVELSYWERIFEMFSAHTKFAIVLVNFAWTLLIHLGYKMNFGEITVLSFKIFLQIPDTRINRYKFRLGLAFWIFGHLVLTVAMISYCQGILFTAKYVPVAYDESDIVKSNLTVHVEPMTLEIFKNSSGNDHLLYSKMSAGIVDLKSFITDVCVGKKAAMISGEASIFYLGKDICYDQNSGKFLYHTVKYVNTNFRQIYFVKGYPPLDSVNNILRRLIMNGGLVNHISYNSFIAHKKLLKTRRKVKFKPIDLAQLHFSFIALKIGWTTALIVFLIETYMIPKLKA